MTELIAMLPAFSPEIARMQTMNNVVDVMAIWQKERTSAVFIPPERIEPLKEAVARVLYLDKQLRSSKIVPEDAWQPWARKATFVLRCVEKAHDLINPYLNEHAIPNVRDAWYAKMQMWLVGALEAAETLQREMERDYQLVIGGRYQAKKKQLPPPQLILARARKLLWEPGTWSQGAIARDASNRPTKALSRWAQKWSLVGAVRAVSRFMSEDDLRMAFVFLGFATRTESITALAKWNDVAGRRLSDVHRAIDTADLYLRRQRSKLQRAFEFDQPVKEEEPDETE